MSIEIISNFHWRNFVYGYALPENVRADFDWIEDIDSTDFIFYRGRYYVMDEFMVMENWATGEFSEWHGYASDSFFSGVLVRLSDDGEQYQIATYIA